MPIGPYEVYVIVSDDFWYVGSASGKQPFASRRFAEHMGGGVRAAKCFKELLPEIGASAFSQIVLESGVGDHIAAEDAWYRLGLVTESRQCLNGKPPADWGGSFAGQTHTPEARKKIAAAGVGRPKSESERAAISERLRGHEVSAESREKMRIAKLGKPGVPHTPEWNEAIRRGTKGIKPSAKAIRRSIEVHKGKPLAPETRAKISAKLTGVPTPQRQEQCEDCGMISTGSGIDRHARKSGHVGRRRNAAA